MRHAFKHGALESLVSKENSTMDSPMEFICADIFKSMTQ